MTALPEAKLAREAELCYALMTSVTDYDSWHMGHETVDATTVLRVLGENVGRSRQAILNLLERLPSRDECSCGRSLDAAIVTTPEAITPEVRSRLEPILGRVLGKGALA
jgi:5'-methylthioadenosine phosphorylase